MESILVQAPFVAGGIAQVVNITSRIFHSWHVKIIVQRLVVT